MIDLRKARTDAGLTQQELADECHVIRQTIGNIENGIANPSVELAKRMGKVLGVKWTEFFDE